MAKEKRKQAYARGHKGEGLAAFWLILKGHKILQKRCKTPVGEIDLIARKGQTLLFVEVKARADFETGAEAITTRQKQRIIRAAQYYLSGHPEIAQRPMRFDVILHAPPLKLRHIKNAWQT